MQLLNNLYTIVAKDIPDDKISYNIKLDANHFIYQAHFPNEPITPGACIIQIAKELLEDSLAKRLKIYLVKNVKFLSIISPITTPQISCIYDKIMSEEKSNTYHVQVHLQSNDTPLAKLSFTCKHHDGKQ
jgi:3-hydroxyacyl-[acyl-carrier-protein] dehydratase